MAFTSLSFTPISAGQSLMYFSISISSFTPISAVTLTGHPIGWWSPSNFPLISHTLKLNTPLCLLMDPNPTPIPSTSLPWEGSVLMVSVVESG